MARESCVKRGGVLAWIIAFIVVLTLGLVWLINTSNPPAHDVSHLAQFYAIEVGLEAFKNEYGYYPPSNDNSLPPVSEGPTPYCGANKLAEAMVGSDLMGFHPESKFRSDGKASNESETEKALYDTSSLDNRKEHFVELHKSNPYMLSDIFEPSVLEAAGLNPNSFVLCDVFSKKRHFGKKVGMPILYYRADTSKTGHNVDDPDSPDNIYNYKDNQKLLSLGVSGKSQKRHPLFKDPGLFYKMTRNNSITTASIPHHEVSFIIISAGRDGLYGTEDDIFNFSKE